MAELLVVAAIIVILAATLFPLFAWAREAARWSRCLSNVNQSCTGVTMHARNHDDTLPVVHSLGCWWFQVPGACVRNAQLLRCPSQPRCPVGRALKDGGNGGFVGGRAASPSPPTCTVPTGGTTVSMRRA